MRDDALEDQEDQELHLASGVQLEKPRVIQFPQSTHNAPKIEFAKVESTPIKEEKPEPFIIENLGRIAVVVGAALLIAVLVWASGPLIEMAHHEIGMPESRPTEPSRIASTKLPTPTPTPVTSVTSITSDSLHVSSIALGAVRLACVNGQILRENDALKIKTQSGDAILRVAQIEDGIVHFEYGSQLIHARMASSVVHKAPTH